MFSITKKQGIALIELNSPPVNALDLKMRKALSASIAELGTDDEIKAMVICSALPLFFVVAPISMSSKLGNYGKSLTYLICVWPLKIA